MTEQQALTLLDEAERLLDIAWAAMTKMRLNGRGNDISMSHEVRMFALEFSEEQRSGDGALQTEGTGRYRKWRHALRAAGTI